jgi:hypothetical protein
VTTRNLLFFLFFVLFIPRENLQASDSLLTWSGEIRTRGEIDGRDFQNSTPANLYALLRARVAVDVRPLENIDLFVQIQDSRYFGQPAGLNDISLYQGYLRVANFPLQGVNLALGRMEIAYGNEEDCRQIDWTNVGRSFDRHSSPVCPGSPVSISLQAM